MLVDLELIREQLGAVAEPRAFLEGLFATLPVPVEVYDTSGHLVVANEAVRRLYGRLPPPEYNILADEVAERAGIRQLIVRAYAGEIVHFPAIWYDPKELEHVAVDDAERVAIEGSLFPLRNGHGEVTHVVVVVRDRTAELRAGRELEVERDRLDAILQGVSEGITLMDASGRVLFANDAAARICGCASVAELVATEPGTRDARYQRMWRADGTRLARDELPSRRVLAGAGAAELTVRVDHRSGEQRWCRISSRSVRGAHRERLALSVLRDVTEERRREEAERLLGEASTMLSASLEYGTTLGQLARLCTRHLCDWCLVYLRNAESSRIERVAMAHQDPAREREVRAFLEVRPPDPDAPYGAPKVMRLGEPELVPEVTDEMLTAVSPSEEALRRLRALQVYSSMSVPLMLRGRAIGAITLVSAESRRRYQQHDVELAQQLADRAAIAVENARLYGEARAAIRVRDEFLTIASHELKTPLTPLLWQVQSIRMTIERARDGHEPPPALVRKLDSIERNVLKLAELTNDLLDMSSVTRRRMRLQPEQVDLVRVVRDICDRFLGDLSAEGTELVLTAPPRLVGLWDPVRLEQIVVNLLSNAAKFGIGKPIEVTIESTDSAARLSVRDHGIGIAPADQERIFQRFERAVSTRHYGGFGLGLWVVSEVVHSLGGSITLESELGAGATFVVELPRKAKASEEEPREGRAHAG